MSLRPHWAGTLCEMNKFDDMMVCLQKSVNGFSQVIAVDNDFTWFGRAWCVAELVEAEREKMRQALQCRGSTVIAESRDHILFLDVRRCEASRVDDQERITSKSNSST